MGFFDFFKRTPSAAILDDLILPSARWEAVERTGEVAAWFSEDRVAVRALRFPHPSPVPLALEAARAQYTGESGQMGGVLLELELAESGAGTVLRSIFKYPSPGNPMATAIVGILLLSWPEAHIRIHIEDVERGTTGAREAAVMLLMGDDWPRSTEPPMVVESMEEMLAHMAAARRQQRVLPSDDRRHDALLPGHPLSRVRALQGTVLATLSLREGVARSGA